MSYCIAQCDTGFVICRSQSCDYLFHEIAQHILKDASVAVVVGLAWGVDAYDRVEFGCGTVFVGGSDMHRLRNNAIVEFFNAGDIVRFGAIKAEALIGLACGELQRRTPMADQGSNDGYVRSFR